MERQRVPDLAVLVRVECLHVTRSQPALPPPSTPIIPIPIHRKGAVQ
jgi:hypothetical protein